MENNNSVAFIAKIDEIHWIQGADKIEQSICIGWSSVVQKDIHEEGDLVLCIVNDAVIPEELAIKWGVKNYLRKGNRVRTVKLKGILSECILIPLNELSSNIPIEVLGTGDCMMQKLNITKYEPPINNKGQGLLGKPGRRASQANNNFHIYHKFPNAKNVPNMFNENDMVEVTRKYTELMLGMVFVRKKN